MRFHVIKNTTWTDPWGSELRAIEVTSSHDTVRAGTTRTNNGYYDYDAPVYVDLETKQTYVGYQSIEGRTHYVRNDHEHVAYRFAPKTRLVSPLGIQLHDGINFKVQP